MPLLIPVTDLLPPSPERVGQPTGPSAVRTLEAEVSTAQTSFHREPWEARQGPWRGFLTPVHLETYMGVVRDRI
jgi:hypothetical protein